MWITISSDVVGLFSTKHLRRNAVLHPGNDVVMMRWLCHLISQWGVGLNTSDPTQWSGLVTRIASDLCRAHQKYPCTVWSIICLQQWCNFLGIWNDAQIFVFAECTFVYIQFLLLKVWSFRLTCIERWWWRSSVAAFVLQLLFSQPWDRICLI